MAAVGKGWINSPTRGAFYNEEEALQVYALLRAAGADVNAQTHFNETPLHSAALRGWNEIVKRLVTVVSGGVEAGQRDLTAYGQPCDGVKVHVRLISDGLVVGA